MRNRNSLTRQEDKEITIKVEITLEPSKIGIYKTREGNLILLFLPPFEIKEQIFFLNHPEIEHRA
jgi:hypothetical protein